MNEDDDGEDEEGTSALFQRSMVDELGALLTVKIY